MNILLCNTSERIGGAAIAARRLMFALRSTGNEARMFVRDKSAKAPPYVVKPTTPRLWQKSLFVAERVGILRANKWHRHRLFEVDTATHGIDLTRQPLFRAADVVHLHWINQGLFSLAGIAKILRSGKPVVWTLHDMWPITGICHHSRECEGWMQECGNCPLLRQGSPADISHRRFLSKRRVYSTAPIHFVACSDWLAGLARKAPLLKGHSVHSIPNPIDTAFFRPGDSLASRKRLGLPENAPLLLFVAYKATDTNKGIDYLRQSVARLAQNTTTGRVKPHLVIVGREATTLRDTFALPAHTYEYVSSDETMRDFYRAATLLCMPTLQDNLPNTIVEAMACGTPTVGFHIGGLPQLISHKTNGYLAVYKDSGDFAEGISLLLDQERRRPMLAACRDFAVANFSQKAVAEAYLQVYNEALKST